MGETSSEIKRQIDEQRRSLGENLSELEARAKHAVDWRSRVERHPVTALGLAVGAGALLGALSVRSSKAGRLDIEDDVNTGESPRVGSFPGDSAWNSRKKKIGQTLDTLTDAFMGVATSRVKEFLGSLMPGFGDQYDRAERERRNGSEFA